jgi:hypothetical protein
VCTKVRQWGRQDAGDSGSCPMKTGPEPDFAL